MTTLRTLTTGAVIDYEAILRGEQQDFQIQDIAVGLSKERRFAGQIRGTCTVAGHSIRVMQYTLQYGFNSEVQRAALLHDAAEAYLKDIPRGLKQMLPDYQRLEKATEALLADMFGVSFPLPPAVKQADREVLCLEWGRFRDDPFPPGFDLPMTEPEAGWFWNDEDERNTCHLFLEHAKILGIDVPEGPVIL